MCGDGAVSVFTGWIPAAQTAVQNSLGSTDYGTISVTAGPVGATHKVCWGNNPGSDADCTLEIGSFVLHGPVVGVDRYCTLGWPCTLQIAGAGLEATNKIRVLSSLSNCGAVASTKFSALFNQATVSQLAPYDSYDLKTETAGPHGEFRLCWGSAPSGDAHFTLDIGTFRMVGPTTENFGCTLGMRCVIALSDIQNGNASNVLQLQDPVYECTSGAPSLTVFDHGPRPDQASFCMRGVVYQVSFCKTGAAKFVPSLGGRGNVTSKTSGRVQFVLHTPRRVPRVGSCGERQSLSLAQVGSSDRS